MVVSSFVELLTTGSLSFFLGWGFKHYRLNYWFKNFGGLPANSIKLVLVVRSDLSMSKGKVAAQCSHAAVSCYKEGMVVYPNLVKEWEYKGQPKIVLRTMSGEEGLRSLAKEAANLGLVATIVRDAGHTQVAAGTATVLGIGPGCAIKLGKLTSDLKLL